MHGSVTALIILVLALGTWGSASGDTGDGLHHEGGMVLMRHVVGHTDREGTGKPETFTCGSDDAQATLPTMAHYCTTGQHRSHFMSITLGFHLAQPGLTGTLDNVVLSGAGEARLRCSWVDGNVTGCTALQTDWPDPGDPFCHGLWAYDTPVLPLAPVPDLHDCDAFVDGTPTSPGPAGIGPAEGPWWGYLIYAAR